MPGITPCRRGRLMISGSTEQSANVGRVDRGVKGSPHFPSMPGHPVPSASVMPAVANRTEKTPGCRSALVVLKMLVTV